MNIEIGFEPEYVTDVGMVRSHIIRCPQQGF